VNTLVAETRQRILSLAGAELQYLYTALERELEARYQKYMSPRQKDNGSQMMGSKHVTPRTVNLWNCCPRQKALPPSHGGGATWAR
jgi:uncharacterized protein YfbU (UPF0304 family)